MRDADDGRTTKLRRSCRWWLLAWWLLAWPLRRRIARREIERHHARREIRSPVATSIGKVRTRRHVLIVEADVGHVAAVALIATSAPVRRPRCSPAAVPSQTRSRSWL